MLTLLNGCKRLQVEPIIEKNNLGLVHHIIIYGCYGDNVDMEHLFSAKRTGHECYSANMPSDMHKCRAPVAVWAIGGGVRFDISMFPSHNFSLKLSDWLISFGASKVLTLKTIFHCLQ